MANGRPSEDRKPALAAKAYTVTPSTSLRDTIGVIDRNGAGIAIIVGDNDLFLNLVTDGDIRRAILQGGDLNEPIQSVLDLRAVINTRPPITALVDDPDDFVLTLMERVGVHQMPLLDGDGRLIRVAVRDLLTMRPRISGGNAAVVMAGGFGTRLRPLTETVPKPMVPVVGRPILEHTVRRLVQAGIERIFISVHYLPEVITNHFGDGAKFGCEISYITEATPLGTAGAVGLADHGGEALLVMNGDVMTDLDFVALFNFHNDHGAAITMAGSPYEVGVPYGVMNVEGSDVTGLQEKPIKRFYINTGIYVVSPEACGKIPADTFFNMTDLIDRALADKDPVKVYAMHEYWRDIGRIEDLQRVNLELGQTKFGQGRISR
jgi:dTDP-glucose pyrophosphorylase